METKEIQKLIDFIAQSGLDEVSVETNDLKLNIKRYGNHAPVQVVASMPQPVAVAAPVAQPVATSAAVPATPSVSNHITIKSPMIGTFYRASKPDQPALAEVGTEIKPGKAICIIEAMKLFNEIEAEISGRIVKVLVENATPVEFDQPLFIVEPI